MADLVITDNTSFFTVESDATGDVRVNSPKNSMLLYRRGDKFVLEAGNGKAVMSFKFSDVATVNGSAPADADALETALNSTIFK